MLPGESYEQNSFRPDRRRSACGPKNDVRFYLNGVLIESHADGAIIVATDGHRMLVVRTSLPWDIGKIIVPRNACELVAKMKGDVYFSAVGDASRFKAERGGQAIEFAAVDGTYPDWRAAVSAERTQAVRIRACRPRRRSEGGRCNLQGIRRQGHFTDSGDWRRRGGHVRYWRHHRSEHQVRVFDRHANARLVIPGSPVQRRAPRLTRTHQPPQGGFCCPEKAMNLDNYAPRARSA